MATLKHPKASAVKPSEFELEEPIPEEEDRAPAVSGLVLQHEQHFQMQLDACAQEAAKLAQMTVILRQRRGVNPADDQRIISELSRRSQVLRQQIATLARRSASAVAP